MELTKEELNKRKWDKRFMEVANLVAGWSSCVRKGRQVGSVIVKDRRIVATGYNGAPAGIKSCAEKGVCLRDEKGIESGTRAEFCYATHAEQNALVQTARLGISVDGATIYVTHRPCVICTKLLINAGIKRIVYEQGYPDDLSMEILNESDIVVEQLKSDEE